jgi:hypothetical protein
MTDLLYNSQTAKVGGGRGRQEEQCFGWGVVA